MNLSKALCCTTHLLLAAKLSAYRFNDNTLKYIYTYLKNRKQCVRINNVSSEFKDIIFGVLQRLVVGKILFDVYLNNCFICIRKASPHSFADDDTPSFGRSVKLLLETLKTESENFIVF